MIEVLESQPVLCDDRDRAGAERGLLGGGEERSDGEEADGDRVSWHGMHITPTGEGSQYASISPADHYCQRDFAQRQSSY